MAKMIPPYLSPEIKSNAERKVFAWFRDAPDTADWVVLHSLGIANHKNLIYGEVDFVVLAPQYGIFALEVKGGRVSRVQGVWQFINKYGTMITKSRGPFEQAASGAYSLMDVIKRKYGHYSKVSQIFFGFGVMFPDITFEMNEIDARQWQIFDERDKENVTMYIRRLSANLRRQWEEKYGNSGNNKIPNKEDIKELACFFRGDFDKAVSLATRIKNVEDELIQLTEEQLECLDQLEDNPRCLIEGTAGTGKTLIAVETLKRAVVNGEKTALFCFNTKLGLWLQKYFAGSDAALRPEYIGTFHDYILQITAAAGISLVKPETAGQEFYRQEMPLAALEAAEKLAVKFDRIIIDEAQDLINENYLEVFDTLLQGGIRQGRWNIFGDFTQQAIYSDLSGGDMKTFLDNRAAYVKCRLKINCRNTKPIAAEIRCLTGFDKDNKLLIKTEGPPVSYYQWNDSGDQKEKLETILEQLLKKDEVPPKNITILAPVRREHSVIAELSIPIADYEPDITDTITFSTIQAFKGLENACIILTGISSYEQEKLMYVGLSRARSALIILESTGAHRQRIKVGKLNP
jgi:hypothetical protein